MLKEISYYYNRHIIKILSFSIFILLPLQLFLFGWTYYLAGLDLDKMENILVLFAYILMFVLTIRPFAKLYQEGKKDEEFSLKEMVNTFLSHFGMSFLGSLVLFVFSFIGFSFFIVPGVIILMFVFLLPLFQQEGRSIKRMIQEMIHFFLHHFFSIGTDVLLLLSVNLLIWTLLSNLAMIYDTNLIALTLLRIIINLFLFPLMYFYLMEKYQDTITL